MKILQIFRRCAVHFLLAAGFTTCSLAAEDLSRVAVFMSPPTGVPAEIAMPRGPLLGNGDLAVAMAGPPEEQHYYVDKNDFWRRIIPAFMTVGDLTVSIPSLQGATYRMEQDMTLAEVRGTFSKDGCTIRTRSWVDANENLLLIELRNDGGPATEVFLSQGVIGQPVPPFRDNIGAHLNIGRAQHDGKGSWYFQGDLADVNVTPWALTAAEIQAAAQKQHPDSAGKAFNGKTDFEDRAAPAVEKAVTVSAWIRIEGVSGANYIVSKGAWNSAYSLGLSKGCLRWSIGGQFIQSQKPLELHKWIHVAGVFDEHRMCEYADGTVVASLDSARGGAIDHALGAAVFTRKADPSPEGREVTMASRFLGATPSINAQGGLSVMLEPGATVTVASAVLSDLDAKDDGAAALKRIGDLRVDDISGLTARHRKWWSDFWSRSFIEIRDKEIEKHWYAALYIMGSRSRAGKVAPGLCWITLDPPPRKYTSDYHLNYNFQAPFYIVYSSNHPDLALPYYQAIMEFIPQGRAIAASRGWKGVHFPVGIGPWGLCTEMNDWGQRSNAALAALNFIWGYQYTQDTDFLRKTAYPYMLEVADFWEDYLKFENGRYVDDNDSVHEGSGPNVNPILTLGVLRTFFKNLLVMSKDLGVDADRRAKWQDILDHLSAYPVQERGGKTVFRLSEKGPDWRGGNTVAIYPVFTAGAIDLDSDPKTLEIARNTIDAMQRWDDRNGFANWYTACARVGYDPKAILAHLREQCDRHSLPNLLLNYLNDGSIENCSGFLAINEMMLQSNNGVLRLFPCWPAGEPARFGGLRAEGAFLVAAEMKDGQIGGVKILSEKGRDCTIVNPWPGHEARVLRDGKPAESESGERFTLKTSAAETLDLKPE